MDAPRFKRLPFLRFSLRTLLLLPAVFAVGWWWFTWPDRTLERFGDYLAAGNLEAARAMCDSPQSLELLWTFNVGNLIKTERPAVAKPSWRDRLLARREFRLPWTLRFPRTNRDLRGEVQTLVATRNRITISPANAGQLTFSYSLRGTPAVGLVGSLSQAMEDSLHHFQLSRGSITARISDNSVITSLPRNQQEWLRAAIIGSATDFEVYRAAMSGEE